MIQPPFLKKGDKIGIISTARKVTPHEIEPAIKQLEGWGLSVVFGEDLFNAFHQFAGTDEQRLLDFQKMLDEPSIKAILFARGGYGTVRIIDKIDFSAFKKNPKWLIGFSDITVLHAHCLQHFNTATVHSLMAINFPKDGSEDEATKTLRKVLFGDLPAYYAPFNALNRTGTAEGVLTGGNLSILYSLTGTASQPETAGKILLLEDLDEYLYHVDRMMVNLKRSGMLQNLAGLIVGGFTEMKDNNIPFGRTAEEIIADAVKEYNYPVCFEFPSGHIQENQALILGKKVKLQVEKGKSTLSYF